jgi:hypothetical protein
MVNSFTVVHGHKDTARTKKQDAMILNGLRNSVVLDGIDAFFL